MPGAILDNIPWHSLAGLHARYASGAGGARRYAPGFSPIVAFANPDAPDFAALAEVCAPGEHFYAGGLSGAVPPGWQIEADTTANQMLWSAASPVDDRRFDDVRLGPGDVPQMLELVAITQPGPFATRTIELGEYRGVFEAGRLIAMAGERMAAGPYREISGVCTHPEFQGRGLARHLVRRLVGLELQRGKMPFLHVMQDNGRALRIYERMGFRNHQEVALQILSRR